MVSKICLFSPLKLGRNDRISLVHIFQVCGLTNHQMAVSKNRGTPKSSILIGFSIIFTIHFWGFPIIFGNTQIGHFSSLFWNKGWELLRLGVGMFSRNAWLEAVFGVYISEARKNGNKKYENRYTLELPPTQ